MILLVSVASALELSGTAETVAQARPDMTGATFVGISEYLAGSAELGETKVEGYGALAWPSGIDQPIAPELYLLTVDGAVGRIDWTVGRQRIELSTWSRMFDGGRIAWSPSTATRLEGWAGFARHVGLDGVTAGAPVARLAGSYSAGALSAGIGAWGELGDAPALHPDLRVRYSGRGALLPDVSGLAALGVGGGMVLERARLDVGLVPFGGVHTRLWGEHRQALPELSLLGPSILQSFAPDGTDEVGLGVGWNDVRRNEVWASGSVQRWAPDVAGDDAQTGLSAEVAWRPNCDAGSFCLRPSWKGLSGPGGYYSSFLAAVTVPTPDVLAVDVYGMVAPYRKPHEAVDTVAAGGATVSVLPTDFLAIGVGGELARDTISPLTPRAWATLRLGEAR